MAEEFGTPMSGESGSTTNVLMVVAVIAVAVAIFGVTMTVIQRGEVASSTGYVGLTDKGNATLEIQGVISIDFSNDLVDWGTGSFDSGTCSTVGQIGYLDTESGTVCTQNFNTVDQGLTLDNIGSVNATINLTVDIDEIGLFGAPATPGFQWKAGDNTSIACLDSTSNADYGSAYHDVTTIADGGDIVCDNLVTGPDAGGESRMNIDLNVSFNSLATAGTKWANITAEASAY